MQKCKIYFRFQSTSTKLFSLSIYLPIQHFSVRATSIFCPNLSIGIPHDKPLTNGKNNVRKQLTTNVSRKSIFLGQFRQKFVYFVMLGSAAAGFIFPSCRPRSFANGEDEVCQFLKIFVSTEISILIRHETGNFNLSEDCVPICQLFLNSEQVKSFNTRQQLNYLSVFPLPPFTWCLAALTKRQTSQELRNCPI